MSNMSYCKFRNTANDLRDCQDTISDMCASNAESLSKEELNALKNLVRSCQRILEELNSFGENFDMAISSEELLTESFDSIIDELQESLQENEE